MRKRNMKGFAKKTVAIVTAAMMVMSTQMAWASEVEPWTGDPAENGTGSAIGDAEVISGGDRKIIRVVLPTMSPEQLKYRVDPEMLIYEWGNQPKEGDEEGNPNLNLTTESTLYFKNTMYDEEGAVVEDDYTWSDTSDTLTAYNKSSVDVDINVKVCLVPDGETPATIGLSTTRDFTHKMVEVIDPDTGEPAIDEETGEVVMEQEDADENNPAAHIYFEVQCVNEGEEYANTVVTKELETEEVGRVNEDGDPIDEDGNVVAEGSEDQAVDLVPIDSTVFGITKSMADVKADFYKSTGSYDSEADAFAFGYGFVTVDDDEDPTTPEVPLINVEPNESFPQYSFNVTGNVNPAADWAAMMTTPATAVMPDLQLTWELTPGEFTKDGAVLPDETPDDPETDDVDEYVFNGVKIGIGMNEDETLVPFQGTALTIDKLTINGTDIAETATFDEAGTITIPWSTIETIGEDAAPQLRIRVELTDTLVPAVEDDPETGDVDETADAKTATKAYVVTFAR